MPQDKRLWHTTIIPYVVIALCCSCGIYIALVSLVSGTATAIPASCSILMFLLFLHIVIL